MVMNLRKQIPLITVITTKMIITIAIPLMTSHRVELKGELDG